MSAARQPPAASRATSTSSSSPTAWPEAVVDRLEAVEVEHEHARAVPAALGAGHGLVDALGQQRAVGELGQRVVEGEALQLPVRVGELAGALGHPPLEVLVERLQLLRQHVDADDHGVDVVRGGRGRQADGRVRRRRAGRPARRAVPGADQAGGVAIGTHREGMITFRRMARSRTSVDGATRRDRLVGGASRSRVTRPCPPPDPSVGRVNARLTLVAHASTAATTRAAFAGDEGLEPRGAAAAAAADAAATSHPGGGVRPRAPPWRRPRRSALAAHRRRGLADWDLGEWRGRAPQHNLVHPAAASCAGIRCLRRCCRRATSRLRTSTRRSASCSGSRSRRGRPGSPAARLRPVRPPAPEAQVRQVRGEAGGLRSRRRSIPCSRRTPARRSWTHHTFLYYRLSCHPRSTAWNAEAREPPVNPGDCRI